MWIVLAIAAGFLATCLLGRNWIPGIRGSEYAAYATASPQLRAAADFIAFHYKNTVLFKEKCAQHGVDLATHIDVFNRVNEEFLSVCQQVLVSEGKTKDEILTDGLIAHINKKIEHEAAEYKRHDGIDFTEFCVLMNENAEFYEKSFEIFMPQAAEILKSFKLEKTK